MDVVLSHKNYGNNEPRNQYGPQGVSSIEVPVRLRTVARVKDASTHWTPQDGIDMPHMYEAYRIVCVIIDMTTTTSVKPSNGVIVMMTKGKKND